MITNLSQLLLIFFRTQKGHEGYIQVHYFQYNESEWGLGLYNFKVIKKLQKYLNKKHRLHYIEVMSSFVWGQD